MLCVSLQSPPALQTALRCLGTVQCPGPDTLPNRAWKEECHGAATRGAMHHEIICVVLRSLRGWPFISSCVPGQPPRFLGFMPRDPNNMGALAPPPGVNFEAVWGVLQPRDIKVRARVPPPQPEILWWVHLPAEMSQTPPVGTLVFLAQCPQSVGRAFWALDWPLQRKGKDSGPRNGG